MKNICFLFASFFLFSQATLAAEKLTIEGKPNYEKFINFIKNDELNALMVGKNTFIDKSIAGDLSASQLISEYEKNELAANKKYKDKLVRVKGKAAEIGEDITKKAYVKINGKNQFESVMLYVDASDEKVLSLSKGQTVDFVCKMSKYIMHTPILSDCLFSNDYAKSLISELGNISDDGKYALINSRQDLYLYVIYVPNENEINKIFSAKSKTQSKQLSDFLKSKKSMENIELWVSENKGMIEEIKKNLPELKETKN